MMNRVILIRDYLDLIDNSARRRRNNDIPPVSNAEIRVMIVYNVARRAITTDDSDDILEYLDKVFPALPKA